MHELTLTFIRPRDITFDRFQLFKAQQQPNESQEPFYSRLRELGLHCRSEHLEEDITNDLFISNMNNTSIQMELLSEVRTPQREHGQVNQQEILRAYNNSSWSQVSYIRQNRRTSPPMPDRHSKFPPTNKTDIQTPSLPEQLTSKHGEFVTLKMKRTRRNTKPRRRIRPSKGRQKRHST